MLSSKISDLSWNTSNLIDLSAGTSFFHNGSLQGYIQSTLVTSNSKGLDEICRVISSSR